MKKLLVVTTSLFGLLAMQGLPARADADLDARMKDPKQWASPTQNNENTRFSTLNQITAANVGKLQVAWTFSTGVLRGHEGSPLVIGDSCTFMRRFPIPSTLSI
jgi:glucose dehydrogenase